MDFKLIILTAVSFALGMFILKFVSNRIKASSSYESEALA